MHEKDKQRLDQLQDELRAACAVAAQEPTAAKFRALLTKELRGAQYVVTENWVQNDTKIEILAWKNGTPIAMRIIEADELIAPQLDGLEKIRFERAADRDKHVLRVVIHLGQFNDYEAEDNTKNHGYAWIAPKANPAPAKNVPEPVGQR